MALSGTICLEGEQSHCWHYRSGVKKDNTLYLISWCKGCKATETAKYLKGYQCYILIYKKNGNFLIVPPNSWNDILGVSSTSKLIPQTLETMNRHSVLQELEKTANLATYQGKEEASRNKVKSPV